MADYPRSFTKREIFHARTSDNPRSGGRLTEKAKYHFDAELCGSLAEAVKLAHANTRRGLLVCGGEAAALEAAELLVNN